MKITDVAIDKSLTVYALMVIITFMGAVSYLQLPRESSPDVKIPFVMVYAPYYGSSPEEMEKLVTRKLETQLKGLADMKEMTSESSEGVSTVVMEFTPDVVMSDALQSVRDAVELAKPELPDDVKEDLIVKELSADDWPIMQVVLSGKYDPALLKHTAEDLQEAIEQLSGVLSANLSGGIEREVRVDVDPDRLMFYGLGLPDLLDAIALENVTIPGGGLKLGTYDYQVRVPGEFQSTEEIEGIVVNHGAATPVYVRDVARVSFGVKERSSISRLNGEEAVTLSVTKRSGENIIEIAEGVHAALDRLGPTFPPGTDVAIVSDQSVQIRDMVSELENNILSGLILVVVCLFAFLGLRNSFFVGAAIPFSMLISFIVLRFLGMTLNMMVLFSLILALGMLVDNAIVVVENIYRHRSAGMDGMKAARFGTEQVATPVVASTLTTLCAFGPLVFWPGIMGEFMKWLPITVIITLAASLLVALVFNPVLCANLMTPPRAGGEKKRIGDRAMDFGLRTYEPVLRWCLHHRWRTLIGMGVIFIGMFIAFGAFNAGVELFPDTDPTFAFASVEAPSGTRLELSNSYAHGIEGTVEELPDLKAVVTEVGTSGGGGMDFGGPSGGPANQSRITMEFVKREYRDQSSRLTLTQLREKLAAFTGAKLTIDKMEEGPPTGAPVNIEISGDDFDVLGEMSARVQDRIRDIPGLVDLSDNYDRGRPEIVVRPDLDKAARLGLRTIDVASTIRTAIHGNDISKYRVGEDEYDIVVRFDQPSRRTVEDIEKMTVFYEGQSIPLTAFAEVEYASGIAAIHRIDAQRVVTVSGDVTSGTNANAVLAEVQQRLGDFPLPAGYRIDFTGESEDQEEAMAFLFSPSGAFVTALLLILIVLITQFNSVTNPFVIMSSVILSLVGVFLGLMVTRTPFGIIMTGVGVISLAGIVVNNAIVLVHYVNLLRQDGMDKYDAIIEAGRTRFRPVILTAVTTILGLVPLTTGFSVDFGRLFTGDFRYALVIGGESSQWWGPMGVAVIWGLAVATFLTLVVVPVMYSAIDPVLRALGTAFRAIGWVLTGGRMRVRQEG
ncbi:efflux RND transporter permease subunit [bacterium]|nr:efflux RND transporter permease subunit [bacterium]